MTAGVVSSRVTGFHNAAPARTQQRHHPVPTEAVRSCRMDQHYNCLLFLKAVHAAATFFAKNALGRPTNRAWPMTPLTNAAVVIGL